MKKKLSINDVLNEFQFTEKEADIFISCINIVKEERKNSTINAEAEITNIIKGVVEDEN